jgi:hypothetical protein
MIITLYKTGTEGRIHYYTIHDRQPVFDAPFSLCTSWRIGTGRERERLLRFETSTDRDKAVRSLVARRIKDGYRILYFFSRSKFSIDLTASSTSPASEAKKDAKSAT